MSATDLSALEKTIEAAFDNRDSVSISTKGEIRDAVEASLNLLDSGEARVAVRGADGTWTVNQWLKKAVLLSFRLNDMEVVKGGQHGGQVDRVGPRLRQHPRHPNLSSTPFDDHLTIPYAPTL